jgi:hypothetical protein
VDEGGGLNIWTDFVERPWTSEDASGEYREVLVNVRDYLQQLVLGGSTAAAVRAAKVLLKHPPVADSSRAAIASRFPQGD